MHCLLNSCEISAGELRAAIAAHPDPGCRSQPRPFRFFGHQPAAGEDPVASEAMYERL